MGSKEPEKIQTKASPEPVNRFRYFCDACTGIAFKSVEKRNPGVNMCASCHKTLGAIKDENFIPL